MPKPEAVVEVRFFASTSGREPVREWLKGLPREERKAIGEDLTPQADLELAIRRLKELKHG